MPSDRACKERNEEGKEKKKEKERERPCSQHLIGFTVFGEGVGLKNDIEVT